MLSELKKLVRITIPEGTNREEFTEKRGLAFKEIKTEEERDCFLYYAKILILKGTKENFDVYLEGERICSIIDNTVIIFNEEAVKDVLY